MKSVMARETVKGESNKCICERDYITPCTYVGTRLDGFFFLCNKSACSTILKLKNNKKLSKNDKIILTFNNE